MAQTQAKHPTSIKSCAHAPPKLHFYLHAIRGNPHFKEMWNDVNENIQEQDVEQDIISRVSELKEQNGTINALIDQVMEDAPTKLKVIVTLCDADWEKMQKLHNQWPGEEKRVLEDHHRWQKESWQKQSQRLTDIVKNNEGVWISTKLFYAVGSLSLLSIITIVLEIAFYVYFHWIL